MRASYEKIVHKPNRSFTCYRREDASFDFEYHVHPEYELTLIERGRGMRYVGDRIEPYQAGDLVLIGSNVPHTWSSIEHLEDLEDGDTKDADGAESEICSAVVIQFDREHLIGRLEDLSELDHIGLLLDAAAMGVKCDRAQFDEARSQISKMPGNGIDPASQYLMLLTVLHLMARRQKAWSYILTDRATVSMNENSRRQIDLICRYIEAHYDEPIEQSALASMVGMKPSAYTGFFRRATGRTPSEHLGIVRINAACRMLSETDQSVLDICFACGFRNVANFNRRFKVVMQMTPGEYRRKAI